MKRTATTLALLAGFGGGCVAPGGQAPKEPTGGFGTVSRGKAVSGYQGPNGEPVMARGVMPAGGPVAKTGGVEQVALFRKYGTPSGSDCNTCGQVPGTSSSAAWGPPPAYGPPPGGPGIYPVPGQGPPGAVAAVGALVPGMGGYGATGAIPNGRASIKFTSPAGMKVTWQLPNGGFNDEVTGLTAPKEYNFLQGQVYRLRLTQILPNHPGKSFYPTLEVASGNPKTVQFLAHSCVPITFTNEDFDHAVAGNLVVKVVYLPDRDNQDFLSVAGAEEVNSTRLEPGVDPVAEAQRKGAVLAIIRLGNIDLENRVSPAMTAPPPGGPVMLPAPGAGPGPMGMVPPGALPPGAFPAGTSSVGGPIAPPAGSRNLTPVPPSAPTAPSGPVAPGPLPATKGPVSLPPIK